MELTYNEKLSILRKESRKKGFILRKSNRATYNGIALYNICDDARNEVVYQDTLSSMYERYVNVDLF